ncbi:hypothetical protein NVP1225O_05 [Vibrio phage 1.225.O._10N.261.48.B7]|nr:hypothetical protein NVP1225O_05 [Vibrio phage 1.225.O._10N.261.48.B7]
MDNKTQKVAVLGGMPICATEIDAIFARAMNPSKLPRTNKSDRKRNRATRWC